MSSSFAFLVDAARFTVVAVFDLPGLAVRFLTAVVFGVATVLASSTLSFSGGASALADFDDALFVGEGDRVRDLTDLGILMVALCTRRKKRCDFSSFLRQVRLGFFRWRRLPLSFVVIDFKFCFFSLAMTAVEKATK